MQGGRGRGRGRGGGGGGNPFFGFGDPFAGFGGMPSLFGGRDPFDDPFFTPPFGGIFSSGPSMSPFMDLNPFGSSLFGPRGNPFMDELLPRIHESRPSMPNNSRGPIIEELDSDDEKEQPDNEENPREHRRSEVQPYVEHPDDEFEGRGPRHVSQFGNNFSMMNNTHLRPQAQSFTFQSSTVTYGGPNGAYHTSSTTRRSGSDGIRFEEYKEADSVTGQAAHRVSRGIHDKGHTVARNLKSDGHVDTMQVLHNINQDELNEFEETWKGKTREHLPGLTGGGAFTTHQGLGEASRGGWALPSNEGSGNEVRNHHGSSSASASASASASHVGVRRRATDGGSEHLQSSKLRKH